MARIEVQSVAQDVFDVRIIEGQSESRHRVTLPAKDYERLVSGLRGDHTAKVSPQELIRLSFEFLLEREPKESILKQFNLAVISRYFPEYERKILSRL